MKIRHRDRWGWGVGRGHSVPPALLTAEKCGVDKGQAAGLSEARVPVGSLGDKLH